LKIHRKEEWPPEDTPLVKVSRILYEKVDRNVIDRYIIDE
jgi:hypothetical protein